MMPDGVEISTLLFKAQQPSEGLILYFHGNADNLQRWGNYAGSLTDKGYDVLMVDYRGYGKSTGKPDEQDFYDDAEVVLDWARQNIDFNRLVICGRSLGAAVASQLAIGANPDLLILETPFDEIQGVAHPLFKLVLKILPTRFHFSNKDHLKKISCKVVIIQGTDDWIVPLSSAERLKPYLKNGDSFIVIDGGGHNNLSEFELYHQTIGNALKALN